MPNDRRNRVPGGTDFITGWLQNRTSDPHTKHIAPLREATRTVLQRNPFHIDAWVVLPTTCIACRPSPPTTPTTPAAGAT